MCIQVGLCKGLCCICAGTVLWTQPRGPARPQSHHLRSSSNRVPWTWLGLWTDGLSSSRGCLGCCHTSCLGSSVAPAEAPCLTLSRDPVWWGLPGRVFLLDLDLVPCGHCTVYFVSLDVGLRVATPALKHVYNHLTHVCNCFTQVSAQLEWLRAVAVTLPFHFSYCCEVGEWVWCFVISVCLNSLPFIS